MSSLVPDRGGRIRALIDSVGLRDYTLCMTSNKTDRMPLMSRRPSSSATRFEPTRKWSQFEPPKSRTRQGIVTFEHRGYKQGDELVVCAERNAPILVGAFLDRSIDCESNDRSIDKRIRSW